MPSRRHASSPSAPRASTATRAPAATNRRAVARPTPAVPPVITTTSLMTRRRSNARALAAVAVVLLDLRQDPIELAAGDVGAAVLARARHRDLERRTAVATRELRLR